MPFGRPRGASPRGRVPTIRRPFPAGRRSAAPLPRGEGSGVETRACAAPDPPAAHVLRGRFQVHAEAGGPALAETAHAARTRRAPPRNRGRARAGADERRRGGRVSKPPGTASGRPPGPRRDACRGAGGAFAGRNALERRVRPGGSPDFGRGLIAARNPLHYAAAWRATFHGVECAPLRHAGHKRAGRIRAGAATPAPACRAPGACGQRTAAPRGAHDREPRRMRRARILPIRRSGWRARRPARIARWPRAERHRRRGGRNCRSRAVRMPRRWPVRRGGWPTTDDDTRVVLVELIGTAGKVIIAVTSLAATVRDREGAVAIPNDALRFFDGGWGRSGLGANSIGAAFRSLRKPQPRSTDRRRRRRVHVRRGAWAEPYNVPARVAPARGTRAVGPRRSAPV